MGLFNYVFGRKELGIARDDFVLGVESGGLPSARGDVLWGMFLDDNADSAARLPILGDCPSELSSLVARRACAVPPRIVRKLHSCTVYTDLDSLLGCPVCRSDLETYAVQQLQCIRCRRSCRARDNGIPVFLVNEPGLG